MKKVALFFILFLIMGSTALFAAQKNEQCLETMAKLYTLQNQIVKRSFKALKPGTWARYNDGTLAVYLGQQPHQPNQQGEVLYGIEFQNTKMPAQEIWYAIVPKSIIYHGKKFTFLTLDPRIAYLNLRGMIVRVDKGLIDLYLQRMRPISIGLTPAQIQATAQCVHNTVVVPRSGLRLQGGKVIDASEIEDRTTGGVTYMSDGVPFGYVRCGPLGSAGRPVLVDFGFGGHPPRITEAMRRAAKPAASLFLSPGRKRF